MQIKIKPEFGDSLERGKAKGAWGATAKPPKKGREACFVLNLALSVKQL